MGLALLLLTFLLLFWALWVCQSEALARNQIGRFGRVVDPSRVCHALAPPIIVQLGLRIPRRLQYDARKWVADQRCLLDVRLCEREAICNVDSNHQIPRDLSVSLSPGNFDLGSASVLTCRQLFG